tara:strand:- start:8919 stop:9158 length:240 start_codon:yes stop_codon:yes gene_type:complete
MNLIVRQLLELALIAAMIFVSRSSGVANGILGMSLGLFLGLSVASGLQSGDSKMFKLKKSSLKLFPLFFAFLGFFFGFF